MKNKNNVVIRVNTVKDNSDPVDENWKEMIRKEAKRNKRIKKIKGLFK